MTLNSVVPSDKTIKLMLSSIKNAEIRRNSSKLVRDRDYNIFFIMSETGFRISAVLGLKWGDIDFNEKTITIREENEKTNQFKQLIMSDSLITQLKKWKNKIESKYPPQELVFFSLRRGLFTKLKVINIVVRARNYFSKTGVLQRHTKLSKNGRTFSKIKPTHCFRAWRFTKWAKENPNLRLHELQQLTFHKSISVLSNYYLEAQREKIQKNVILKKNFLNVELQGESVSKLRKIKKHLGFTNDADVLAELINKSFNYITEKS